MPQRCFISAPADVGVAPLIEALERAGWEAFVLSDVATLGASLTDAVSNAIRSADAVLAVFTDRAGDNTAFEVGYAFALGKPVLLVVRPGASLPSDLRGFLYVQAEPHNVEAITLALDNLGRDRASSGPEQSKVLTGEPLGSYADQLLAELNTLSRGSEQEVQELVVRALEASGAVAVASAGRDRGFDVGVWSDDLDAIGGNPLLIELKRNVTEQTVRASLLALHQVPSSRLALIVTLEDAPPDETPSLRWPVLWISLRELLLRLRENSFAEIIRELRNRSVHAPAG